MTPSATSSSLNIFASITSLKNSRSFELLLPKPHKELPLQLTKHSNHKFSRSCCTSHTINSFYNFLTIQPVLRISKNHALSCYHCTRRTKNYLRHHQQCVFENILAPLSIYFGYCLSMKLPLRFHWAQKFSVSFRKSPTFALLSFKLIEKPYFVKKSSSKVTNLRSLVGRSSLFLEL